MSNQAWNDWEEYNLGLQGTETGSMQNQIGLNDRPKPYSDDDYQQPKKEKAKPQKRQKQQQAQKPRSVSSSEGKGLSYLVGIIIGIVVFALLVPKMGNESIFTYLLAAVAATFGYRFYKAILAIVIFVAVIYFFNQ